MRDCGEARYESDTTDPRERLGIFKDQHIGTPPQLVTHRIVHGGARLTSACMLDAEVEAEIERLTPLAPLHNPVTLTWIRACREVFGAQVPQVEVFDTAFYAQLPEVAAPMRCQWNSWHGTGCGATAFTGSPTRRFGRAGANCARLFLMADESFHSSLAPVAR